MLAKAGLGFFIFNSDTMLSSSGLIIKSGIQIMSVQSQSVFLPISNILPVAVHHRPSRAPMLKSGSLPCFLRVNFKLYAVLYKAVMASWNSLALLGSPCRQSLKTASGEH